MSTWRSKIKAGKLARCKMMENKESKRKKKKKMMMKRIMKVTRTCRWDVWDVGLWCSTRQTLAHHHSHTGLYLFLSFFLSPRANHNESTSWRTRKRELTRGNSSKDIQARDDSILFILLFSSYTGVNIRIFFFSLCSWVLFLFWLSTSMILNNTAKEKEQNKSSDTHTHRKKERKKERKTERERERKREDI